MDKEKLEQLISESSTSDTQPTAEAVSAVLTDAELLDAVRRRGFTVSVGEVATAPSVRAQVERMLPAAYEAYRSNVNIINRDRSKNSRIQAVVEGTFKEGAMDALTEPTLEYMRSVTEESKGTTLWIPKSAPNYELTPDEIVALAEYNGNRLGKPLYEWSNRMKSLRLFSAQELSGNDPNNHADVLHLFAPTTYTPRLWGTVDHQKAELNTMRNENPDVNIHSPALAHSIGGWAIHANSGLSLPTNWESTHDRSVEVKSRRFNGDDCVPYSNILNDGSNVDSSWTDVGGDGRAWVWSNLNLAT